MADVGSKYCERFGWYSSINGSYVQLSLGHHSLIMSHWKPIMVLFIPFTDSPLCQGMKALIQSRSTEPRCTSPWRFGEWGKEEVRHRKWGVLRSDKWAAPTYLMWVAGRLSYCRDRKSSLWRSWCFCLSVSSASAGLSFSSSSSSVRPQEISAVEKLYR